MTAEKTTGLTELTDVDGAADWVPIVDVSDPSMALSGTTKKLRPNNLPISTAVQNALDLKASIAYADSLVTGLWDDRGTFNASVNTFPASGGSGTAGAILKGDIWTISVAGTLGGHAVAIGDTVRALIDTPGQTDANWGILENNSGYVPLNAASNLSDLPNAGTARGNLGLTIGSQVQAWDADLDAIASTATVSYGRSFLTLANESAARNLIGIANVVDYGAVDGGADSTAAFQAAINAKRDVYVPAGTYICDSLTLALDGTRLYGDGPSSRITFKAGELGTLITTGTLRVTMKDLDLYGGDETSKKLVSTSTANRSGIDVRCQFNSTIENVTVHGFANEGIFFSDPLVTSPRQSCLRIKSCEIYNNWRAIRAGTTTTLAEYTKISGCTIYQNYYGLYIAGGNILSDNNRVIDNGFGAYILGTGVSNAAHGSFMGGQLNHNAVAIQAQGVASGLGFVFSGVNIFEGDIVLNTSTGIQIKDGIIDAARFYLSGGGPNVIEGNYIPNAYGNIIYHNYAGLADQTRFVGNYFSDGTYLDKTYSPVSDGGLTYTDGSLTLSKPTTTFGSNAIPLMTSNTAPSGTVAYSSQNAAAAYNGFHAFDRNTYANGGWAPADAASLPQWISYQFPVAKIVSSYKVSSLNIQPTWAPNTWTFEGSNNGSSWTVIDTQTGQTGWTSTGETRTYVIPTASMGTYTHYKFNVSAINGGALLAIAELQMTAVNPQVILKDDDAATDQKLWGLFSSRGSLKVGSITDAGVVTNQVEVSQAGLVTLQTTVTTGGTTGNRTINKATGTVNIAAAGTAVTVTNSLVSANSLVIAVLRTNDGTAAIKNVVPASGSFVITLAAAATGEVSIGFIVIN